MIDEDKTQSTMQTRNQRETNETAKSRFDLEIGHVRLYWIIETTWP